MSTVEMAVQRRARADEAAVAWLNASIAMGQDDSRPPLYRTLSVEFFPRGIQFVGCDGTMLFRTWAPYSDNDGFEADQPEWRDRPEDSVVVRDGDKFSIGFMRTLLSALGEIPTDLTFEIEPIEEEAEPPLSDELRVYVLTLHALGQRLSCPLYEGAYPDWRSLQFGMDEVERVDGMTLATRLFAAVGKLKGVTGIDCEFRATDKAILFAGMPASASIISGLLMPMRRPEKDKAKGDTADQIDHGDS